MHGYDISWAAFNIIEVMSSTKLTHKVLLYITLSCFMMKMCLLEKNTLLLKCLQNMSLNTILIMEITP